MSTSDALVRFDGVQKSYDGETLVVRDLNLAVQRGEFLTLLGPSGSGKTTCLMMLAGFETPTSGEITMDGRVLNSIPPHKRNIGMVFQNYALFPHLTVAENLSFPLQVRRMAAADIQERVGKALAMVKLEELGTRYPQQLSGGQQQRVALARALIFDPQLVLMDEPLGALDKQLREHMQIEIRHIHQELGVTIVFVTHDQSEALTLSDRVAVFNDGVIQQIDAPARLYEEPANAFVASFIGENNSLPGKVAEIGDGSCLVQLEGGGTIRAQLGDVTSHGAPTVVSVRPERVMLNGSGAQCENRFSATVEELIYLGDHVRVRVNLAGNCNFMIKATVAQWQHAVRVGDRIDLGVDTAHARALTPPPAIAG